MTHSRSEQFYTSGSPAWTNPSHLARLQPKQALEDLHRASRPPVALSHGRLHLNPSHRSPTGKNKRYLRDPTRATASTTNTLWECVRLNAVFLVLARLHEKWMSFFFLPPASAFTWDCKLWLQWEWVRRIVIPGDQTGFTRTHTHTRPVAHYNKVLYVLLAFEQRNEVLLLLKQINHNEFECQAGQARGRVHKSRMQIITPLSSDTFPSQVTCPLIMSQCMLLNLMH